ncbi:hypothetical protein GYH30_044630 [Glycine max]|uniref:Uncharacterized protein n=1 Tax=Glycine max TaxID=3847 RepID=A0A0R0FW25_SOYBN|nr:hypothetical protein GYH30_044630 [Glycine max]
MQPNKKTATFLFHSHTPKKSTSCFVSWHTISLSQSHTKKKQQHKNRPSSSSHQKSQSQCHTQKKQQKKNSHTPHRTSSSPQARWQRRGAAQTKSQEVVGVVVGVAGRGLVVGVAGRNRRSQLRWRLGFSSQTQRDREGGELAR